MDYRAASCLGPLLLAHAIPSLSLQRRATSLLLWRSGCLEKRCELYYVPGLRRIERLETSDRQGLLQTILMRQEVTGQVCLCSAPLIALHL